MCVFVDINTFLFIFEYASGFICIPKMFFGAKFKSHSKLDFFIFYFANSLGFSTLQYFTISCTFSFRPSTNAQFARFVAVVATAVPDRYSNENYRNLVTEYERNPDYHRRTVLRVEQTLDTTVVFKIPNVRVIMSVMRNKQPSYK